MADRGRRGGQATEARIEDGVEPSSCSEVSSTGSYLSELVELFLKEMARFGHLQVSARVICVMSS